MKSDLIMAVSTGLAISLVPLQGWIMTRLYSFLFRCNIVRSKFIFKLDKEEGTDDTITDDMSSRPHPHINATLVHELPQVRILLHKAGRDESSICPVTRWRRFIGMTDDDVAEPAVQAISTDD